MTLQRAGSTDGEDEIDDHADLFGDRETPGSERLVGVRLRRRLEALPRFEPLSRQLRAPHPQATVSSVSS